MINQIL